MHQKSIRILMTDDHPMIIEGYQNTLLATKKENEELIIHIATNCDESIKAINKSIAMDEAYHVFFFDVSIPPSSDGKYKSGIDLAEFVRLNLPYSKIVLLTMFDEPYRIHSVIKNINPDGFLIKSDLTASELASAFKAVLNNPPFYSGTVNNVIRNIISSAIEIDEINHKILHLLSKGIKTKDIRNHIDLSLSMIEKRKKHLKELFDIEDGRDDTLIKEARSKGFVN